jgi:hypothetical protein
MITEVAATADGRGELLLIRGPLRRCMARLRQISYLVAAILLISSCAGYKEASPDQDTRPEYLGPIRCQMTSTLYQLAKPQPPRPGE